MLACVHPGKFSIYNLYGQDMEEVSNWVLWKFILGICGIYLLVSLTHGVHLIFFIIRCSWICVFFLLLLFLSILLLCYRNFITATVDIYLNLNAYFWRHIYSQSSCTIIGFHSVFVSVKDYRIIQAGLIINMKERHLNSFQPKVSGVNVWNVPIVCIKISFLTLNSRIAFMI